MGLTIYNVGNMAMFFTIPLMAGGIAYSMADKAGFGPGIVVGYIAKSVGAGFLGGVIGAAICGVIAVCMKRVKVKGGYQPFIDVVCVPLVTTLISGILIYSILGKGLAMLMGLLVAALGKSAGIGEGIHNAILAVCKVSDFGGVLNKMCFTYAMGLMDQGIYLPQTICAMSLTTSVCGLGLATLLRPKKFPPAMRASSGSTILLGLMGISEAGIPYWLSDPLRVIFSSAAGAVTVAELMTYVFPYAVQKFMWGGLIAIPIVDYPLQYTLVLIIGTLVTGILYAVLKRDFDPDAEVFNISAI